MKADDTTANQQQSIRFQLILIQMITCTIALVIAGVGFGVITYRKNRCSAIEHLECHTELLACKAESALRDNSAKDALKIIETLQTQQSIVSACIYDSKGAVFAAYLPDGRTHSHYMSPSKSQKLTTRNSHIHAYCPIILKGKLIGSVCIEDNLNSINCIVRHNIIILIIVLVGTFLLAILIALKSQASISNPIINLTRKALRISISSDYSLRMPVVGNKEIQMLSNALNEMLTVTQKKIRDANDRLADLGKANSEINNNKDKLETHIATSKDEIRRANEDLYSEKHEHEQSERMLRHTLIKLETTNQELERFAQISAHDLQEPLRKIKAFADRIMTTTTSDDEQATQNHTASILHSATQMQFMINDLMAFSTLGRRTPIFRTLDLNRIIEQVLKNLQNEIDDSHAEIRVEELPTIDAEKHQMQQMFRHLISNSIKFRQADRPLTIDISATDNNDGTVTISVKDNGSGFDQKYADKIFDIFQRLHRQHTHKGTGVGLAICRRITSVHGGSIRVESSLEEGSTFFIILPSEHKYERKQ